MNISLPCEFYQRRKGAKRKNPARPPSETLKQKQITKQDRESKSTGAVAVDCAAVKLLNNLNQMRKYSKPVQEFNIKETR